MSVKAFDLISCIERIPTNNESRPVNIECLECCAGAIYIGTLDSQILRYSLEERRNGGKTSYICTKQDTKQINSKKPISCLRGSLTASRLLILCDGNLIFADLFNLEIVPNGTKLRGITTFCVNENPYSNNPYCLQICVARKRHVYIYNIAEDKAVSIREITVSEPPIVLCMDGPFVCAALPSLYVMIDFEAGRVQDLFPYNPEQTIPCIDHVQREEFLVSGPSSLGMFVSSAGTSERPPLQWSDGVRHAVYSHPYVLAMDSEAILVYSVLDQKLKQRIQFTNGSCLGNFAGQLLVSSSSAVYSLTPVPWEKQVQSLLDDGSVEDALQFAQNANHDELNKEQFVRLYQRIQQQAGFIRFSQFQFDEAHQLFEDGHLDARELIYLFPGYPLLSAGYTRCIPPLHGIADINQMCHGNKENINECKAFLTRYLESIRQSDNNVSCQQDIDLALFKLYAENGSAELSAHIVSANCQGPYFTECCKALLENRQYHALALLHVQHEDPDSALHVWRRIVDGEYTDSSFPGLTFLVEYLANLSDEELVLKHTDFVLSRDQELGVTIFTERPAVTTGGSEPFKPDRIVAFLQCYTQAQLKYLEFLVLTQHSQKEQFHTHLATLYIDEAVHLLKEDASSEDAVNSVREKLQYLLKSSDCLRIPYLLKRIEDTNLLLEAALLHGKLEKHENAIHILVHELGDYKAAESYCQHFSQNKDKDGRQKLYETLLAAYLDPTLDEHKQQELCAPAIYLLNNESVEVDLSRVLHLLPPSWSVSVVDQLLHRALRSALHTRRMKQIERHLRRSDNVQRRLQRYDLQRNVFSVSEESVCSICGNPLLDPNFVRFPSGSISHISCAETQSEASSRSEPKCEPRR